AADLDSIGRGTHLVGYEADGAAVQIERGVPVLTGADGTPSTFKILGIGVLGPTWQCDFFRPNQVRAATMGLYTRGGASVFTAATTDWARVLASGNTMVDRITQNVIDRLAAPPVAAPIPRSHVLTGETFAAISVCTRNRLS